MFDLANPHPSATVETAEQTALFCLGSPLSAAERERFAEHVGICASCRKQVDDYSELLGKWALTSAASLPVGLSNDFWNGCAQSLRAVSHWPPLAAPPCLIGIQSSPRALMNCYVPGCKNDATNQCCDSDHWTCDEHTSSRGCSETGKAVCENCAAIGHRHSRERPTAA